MRINLKSLILVLGVAGLTACGDAEQQGALEQAIETVRVAEQGYVPASAGEAQPLNEYRQEQLAAAAQQLQQVASGGSPVQQVTARRLLADIDAAAAREAARQAAVAYAEIAPRAAGLIGTAVSAGRAHALTLSLDQRQPEVISGLQEEIAAQRQRQQQLQQEAAGLQKQLDAEQAKLKEILARRDEAMGRAQGLRDQAFVAEGDRQYELYDQASAAEREGNVAGAEAERRELAIDMLNSQLSVLNSQISLTTNLLTELAKRVEAAQQRQQEVTTGVAAAEQDRQAQLQQLSQDAQQLLADFRQRVEDRLQQATDRVSAAVQTLQQAQGAATDGRVRQNIQHDLLAVRTAQANLYAEYLMAVSGMRDVLTAVQASVKSLPGGNVAAIDEAVQQLGQKQADLATQANQAIQSAQELAAGAGEDASAYQQRLQAYAQHVQAAAR